LFVDRGCQSCHKLDGVGGQLGPALDGIADKTRHQLPMAQVSGERTLPNWLLQHFDQPQKIVAGSQMRPPRLTAAENDALTIYMLSLRRRDIPQTYVAPDRIASLNQTLNHKETGGPELYKRYCTNCHGDGTFGSYDRFFNKFMPAVRGPGLRALELERRRNNANAQATTVLQLQPLAAAAFSSYFVTRPVDSYLRTAIEQGRPGTLMPSWGKTGGGLTNAQVDSLVDYLLAGDGRPAQELRQKPAERRGNAEGGGQLFAQLCAGCHGGNALAPSLANAAFQKSASDTFIAQTIANGRHDTAMPAFQRAAADGLSDEDIADLLSYIRSLGRGTTAQP
jgi:mono/diheme cytochrome c family protein